MPSRRTVGEVLADVTQGSRAEQRVANRVSQRVAIRVAHGTFLEGDLDAAENQFASRGEAVQVIANANAISGIRGRLFQATLHGAKRRKGGL